MLVTASIALPESMIGLAIILIAITAVAALGCVYFLSVQSRKISHTNEILERLEDIGERLDDQFRDYLAVQQESRRHGNEPTSHAPSLQTTEQDAPRPAPPEGAGSPSPGRNRTTAAADTL